MFDIRQVVAPDEGTRSKRASSHADDDRRSRSRSQSPPRKRGSVAVERPDHHRDTKVVPPPPPPPPIGARLHMQLSPKARCPHPPAHPPPLVAPPAVPAWASFEFTVEAWLQVMNDGGVDEAAQQMVFLLTQRDQAAGIHVISKFLKKQNDAELGNPSGFIVRSVKNEYERRGLW